MTLWVLMLITQAYLIRINKRKIHRYVGWGSYLLVPAVVITTINLVHYRMKEDPMNDLVLSDLALMINSVIVFVIIYALAIWYKKDSLTHARYMFATIFPMFTPITDRIIYRNVPFLIDWVPQIDGSPIVPVAGFVLADIILIGLLIWDWRSNKRWKEFGLSLALLLVFQFSVLTFHRFEFWQTFGEWFFSLQLS